MTWRTSFPSWWLASFMHCPDLRCLPRCFTSVSSLAVESFTPSCTFLLSLSRAEVWPFWRAMGSPSQWLSVCSAPLSDCRVPWVCVYLRGLLNSVGQKCQLSINDDDFSARWHFGLPAQILLRPAFFCMFNCLSASPNTTTATTMEWQSNYRKTNLWHCGKNATIAFSVTPPVVSLANCDKSSSQWNLLDLMLRVNCLKIQKNWVTLR